MNVGVLKYKLVGLVGGVGGDHIFLAAFVTHEPYSSLNIYEAINLTTLLGKHFIPLSPRCPISKLCDFFL